MSAQGVFGFLAGAVVGAAAGLAAGILIAPRPGAETRDMVAQGANEAWGTVVDTYQKGAQEVMEKANAATSDLGVKSDELREKVDQARARMDQIRSNLAENVSQAAEAASDAVSKAVDAATEGKSQDTTAATPA